MPLATVPHRGPSRWPHRSSLIGSAHTSPSSHSITSSVGQASTISSLRGSYLYLVIQVTRDLHPVVFSSWRLPESKFDLNVSDVTLAQFEALALSTGKNLNTTADDWVSMVSSSMVSLSQLLKVSRCSQSIQRTHWSQILPNTLGVSLELAYPQRAVRGQAPGHRLQLNTFVDSVLRTIYHTSGSLDGALARRRIVFTSFFPDVCSAVNWKQPNCGWSFGRMHKY